MSKISATVITLNEASRVRACLESLRDVADEIVIIDSGSTDGTVEICRKFGAKVHHRQFSGYGAQRQYATSLTTHPYVLSIDADEILSPALRKSILEIKNSGFSHRVYSFARLNFFCGDPVKHCGWYPDYQVRLFDKRYAGWDLRDVSERVIFRDSLRHELLDGDLLHYRCSSAGQYAATERRHASLRARSIASTCSSISPLTPLCKGIEAYIHTLIFQGGILDGKPGKQIALQAMKSEMLSYRLARNLLRKK